MIRLIRLRSAADRHSETVDVDIGERQVRRARSCTLNVCRNIIGRRNRQAPDSGDELILGPRVRVIVETFPERSEAALNLQHQVRPSQRQDGRTRGEDGDERN